MAIDKTPPKISIGVRFVPMELEFGLNPDFIFKIFPFENNITTSQTTILTY